MRSVLASAFCLAFAFLLAWDGGCVCGEVVLSVGDRIGERMGKEHKP